MVTIDLTRYFKENETMFTKGPWKVDFAFGTVMACGNESMKICDPPAMKERSKSGEYSPAEEAFWNGNAQLIAAAPDLYEALKALNLEDGFKYPHVWAKSRAQVQAALAKAEGK
jgi:hypothetical protein